MKFIHRGISRAATLRRADGRRASPPAEPTEASGVDPSPIARDLEQPTARAHDHRPGIIDMPKITIAGYRAAAAPSRRPDAETFPLAFE